MCAFITRDVLCDDGDPIARVLEIKCCLQTDNACSEVGGNSVNMEGFEGTGK